MPLYSVSNRISEALESERGTNSGSENQAIGMNGFPKRRSTFRLGSIAIILLGCIGTPRAKMDSAMAADAQRQIPSELRNLADEIRAAAGFHGGLVAHIGCGDGRLTLALQAGGGTTVHGLDADPQVVASARQFITRQGKYGFVSVEQLRGSRLPYANELVNLVVDQAGSIPEAELLRVIAPGGALCRLRGNELQITRVARPDDIDDWSHFLHDAGNNPVAADERVGPPRSLRWIAPPLWLRSHETPSGIQGLITAAGRVFYFFDEGVVGVTDQRLPERWTLFCRDAFNGRELWKQPLAAWGWPEWAPEKFRDLDWTEIRGGRTVVPVENQRRMVADDRRVYATLAYDAPLSILDAQTGELLHTLDETAPVRGLQVDEGIAIVHSRDDISDRERRRGAKDDAPSKLIAVQGATGQILWQLESPRIDDLFVAIADGRVIYLSDSKVRAVQLSTGQPLWETTVNANGKALIAAENAVVFYSSAGISVFDAAGGQPLWSASTIDSPSAEGEDLFISNGLVWRGMIPVTEDLDVTKKSEDVMSIAYDIRTGEEKKRVVVRGLRSPEHHHRCYRNKATERFLISSMEGAEFMDLNGDTHGQNNFIRGACKLGMVPANGMLYVPADQCFCQPGAKLLGFAAVGVENPYEPVPFELRLERGAAYQSIQVTEDSTSAEDWSTFRYDAARHGSSPTAVEGELQEAWRANIGGRLSQPVADARRVYVAACDAHSIYALDTRSGQVAWSFIAGARIDSPPTLYQGNLLFGSADGYVYCVRAEDGVLAWRFLAAPTDQRIGYFDQIESQWPVHGSILIHNGIAYCGAGRSTYLDGGIRLYALDPSSGQMLYTNTLEGPHRTVGVDRDMAFFIEGANSDVLVAEGNDLYMRQKKFSPQLNIEDSPILSSKGEQDVGLHVFSTAGLLDGSGYNRTFWMYSKRWPGFQLANQASKAGQLLVVDDQATFAVNVFTRRNVHSPMFFPATDGCLIFADDNANEPQIVGDPTAKKAIEWLPQSFIPRDGNPDINSLAFGLDKMIGYTRNAPPLWAEWSTIRVRAMVKADQRLFVAGPPDVLDASDPLAAFEARAGGRLAALSAKTGQLETEFTLTHPPVFDGLIAAHGRLFVAQEDGSLICLAPNK